MLIETNIKRTIMSSRGFRLGKINTIEIYMDYSWILIFILVIWILAAQYFPVEFPGMSKIGYLSLGIITAILFFLSAFLHELAHSIVAIKNNVKIRRITLFLFGGMSELFEEPSEADKEFKISIAGPTTSILLALLFSIIWNLSDRFIHYSPLTAVASTLFQVNVILAIFNLLPGFPLDGGRILRSIIWVITKDLKRATLIATTSGKIIALAIIFFGILQIIITGMWGGIWLILIGLFLNQTAGQSYMELEIREALKGLTVGNLTTSKIMTLAPNLSIDDALAEYFIRYASMSFPVVENDKVVGLISLNDIRSKVSELSETNRVSDVMRPYPSKLTISPEEKAIKALKIMIDKDISFIPVIAENKMIGMITLESVADYLNEREVI